MLHSRGLHDSNTMGSEDAGQRKLAFAVYDSTQSQLRLTLARFPRRKLLIGSEGLLQPYDLAVLPVLISTEKCRSYLQQAGQAMTINVGRILATQSNRRGRLLVSEKGNQQTGGGMGPRRSRDLRGYSTPWRLCLTTPGQVSDRHGLGDASLQAFAIIIYDLRVNPVGSFQPITVFLEFPGMGTVLPTQRETGHGPVNVSSGESK